MLISSTEKIICLGKAEKCKKTIFENGDKMLKLVKRALIYTKKNGIKSFIPRVKRYFADKDVLKVYYAKTALKSSDIKKQRNVKFQYEPLISIIIPLYNTPLNFFNELLDTITNQTYGNWELCLADGTGKETDVTKTCLELMKKDKRIKYKMLENNGGISENTNAALAMATGEFIMLADHDDLLELDALYECVLAINNDMTIDSVYTDEDKVDLSGKKKAEPHLKPDFNIEYLRTNNYICHIFLTRREIALKVGGFSKEYDGAQDFDFILKCTEQSRTVHHVPRVLYHWRCHINSTAAKPESKLYAYEAGVKAVAKHYERCGIPATVRRNENFYGYYIAEREVPTGLTDDVKVISSQDVADINKIINESDNKYILLVSEEIKTEDKTISRLMEYAMEEEVAAVTCKMYDKNNKVVQGPIMLGLDGLCYYSMTELDVDDPGYFRRSSEPQNVTVADYRCVMLKKDIVLAQGGLNEKLPLGLAVFEYSLLAEKDKMRTVFTPYTKVLYTGKQPVPEYGSEEKELFIGTWKERLERGDAYYNKNFEINRRMFG